MSKTTTIMQEGEFDKTTEMSDDEFEKEKEYKFQIVWRNVLILSYLHGAGIYGFFLLITGNVMLNTFIWLLVIAVLSTLGVTGGAHRLWAHKTYKANLPLRILLCVMMTLTFQNHIYEWSRDHRVHHKFAETDADPHNSKRGLFFSHVGWLMVKKHPDVIRKGKTVDMSDLEQDGVVMFQKKFYEPLVVLWAFVMPTLVPYFFWNEDLMVSWYCAAVFRFVFSVNLTWCINSITHLYGPKPYDKTIGATENPVMMILGFGEGFHNYHHAFPWDYKAAEYGSDTRNMTTSMIDMFAKIGWATDLKTASIEMIKKRVARTGDGTWDGEIKTVKRNFKEADGEKEPVWGWGDISLSKEELDDIKIFNKLCN